MEDTLLNLWYNGLDRFSKRTEKLQGSPMFFLLYWIREAAKKVLLMAGPLREGEVKDQAIKEKREKIKKIKFFAASLSIP